MNVECLVKIRNVFENYNIFIRETFNTQNELNYLCVSYDNEIHNVFNFFNEFLKNSNFKKVSDDINNIIDYINDVIIEKCEHNIVDDEIEYNENIEKIPYCTKCLISFDR
jgi:hypothetical protein